MENAIELTHVSKSFGRFKAVDDLSLKVPKGAMFGLLGPNGAGKTTTIRMIDEHHGAGFRRDPDPRATRWTAPRRTGSATCPRSAGSTGR